MRRGPLLLASWAVRQWRSVRVWSAQIINGRGAGAASYKELSSPESGHIGRMEGSTA